MQATREAEGVRAWRSVIRRSAASSSLVAVVPTATTMSEAGRIAVVLVVRRRQRRTLEPDLPESRHRAQLHPARLRASRGQQAADRGGEADQEDGRERQVAPEGQSREGTHASLYQAANRTLVGVIGNC